MYSPWHQLPWIPDATRCAADMTADPQEDGSKVGVKLHVSVLGSSSHSDVLRRLAENVSV